MARTKPRKNRKSHNNPDGKKRWYNRLPDISFEHLIQLLFSSKPRPSPARVVYFNENLPAESYTKNGKLRKDVIYNTNQVKTSKYSVFTFLPRNLLEQFRRVANIFFLAIDILQFFPKFATISPGLVIIPLIVVLAITGLKDGYEDIKRHQSDHHVNQTKTHVLRGGAYVNPNVTAPPAKMFSMGGIFARLKSGRIDEKRVERDEEALRAEEGGGTSADGRPHTPPRNAPETMHGPGVDDSDGPEHQPSSPDEDPDVQDDEDGRIPHFAPCAWEDLPVGAFVKIYNNEPIPADVVVCATSEPENVAFVETKNLDGETNLKSRKAVQELAHLRNARECALAQFKIDAEAPHVDMYKLHAAVVMRGEAEAEEEGEGVGGHVRHAVDAQMVLLRGTVLRNTAWVIGCVLYAGLDTKIMLNSGGTPSKRSKVERQMNPQVMVNLTLLTVLSVICAIADSIIETRKQPEGAYWLYDDNQSGDNPHVNGVVTFANALITFQNVIPISLYISIEFVRTCQAAFIYFDKQIWYEKTDSATLARTWNLSDDLGQIEYVMSDKTGTLTQNKMVFRECSIGGKIYKGSNSISEDEEKKDAVPATADKVQPDKSSESSSQDSSTAAEIPAEKSTKLPAEALVHFSDPELDADLRRPGSTDQAHTQTLQGFFNVLALCHTVLAAQIDGGKLEYRAQSPDEAALVQAAADIGFVFRGRDKEILSLVTPFSGGEVEEYELMNVLDFTSARKRMSVVVRRVGSKGREDEDRALYLFCKGADNVIFERLADGQDDMKEKTDDHLQYFASEGLRTLCLAYRVIPEDEYEEWSRVYHDAEVSLDNRDDNVEAASSQLEQNLRLLGATAIEDKLQDGVPEAIADLKRAGIKVWVATGDKLETAISIGYSTNLLAKDANLIIVRGGGPEARLSVYDQLRGAVDEFFRDDGILDNPDVRPPDLWDEKEKEGSRPPNGRRTSMQLRRWNTGVSSLVGADNGKRPGGYSLVIDGSGFAEAIAQDYSKELLLQVSTRCEAVVCCRVSPKQKAEIVHLVKDGLGAMCLAIGDGANDVSMIQAADVGVGITGEEGLQAVNSSDYAIAQFRFLCRLLFVHGHWSYIRNANMILNFFYKNIVAIGVLFWFQIYCAWSTVYVFEYTYLLLWNVVWSLCPVIAIGIFDRNIDADILMALPELYRYGREGRWFGTFRFSIYMFEAVYQSAVIYFFIQYAYQPDTTSRTDGWDINMYEFSTTMVIATVMAVNLYNGLNTYAWTGWVWFAVTIGPFLVWIFTAIYNAIPPSLTYTDVYGDNVYLFKAAFYWFCLPLSIFLALLPRFIWKTINEAYLPDDIDILRQIRATQPHLDISNHPMLGGHLRAQANEGKDMLRNVEPPENADRPVSEVDQATDLPRPSYDSVTPISPVSARMPSYTSHNYPPTSDRLYRHTSATGSRTDMSTGARLRGPDRGFDFSQEEGGIAIQRMQSHLSEASERRHQQRSSFAQRLLRGSRHGPNRSPSQTSPTSPGIFSSLRRSSRQHRDGQRDEPRPTVLAPIPPHGTRDPAHA